MLSMHRRPGEEFAKFLMKYGRLFTTHFFTNSGKNVRVLLALLKKIMMMGKLIEKSKENVDGPRAKKS